MESSGHTVPSTYQLFSMLSKEVADGKVTSFNHGMIKHGCLTAIEADNFTLYVRDPTQDNVSTTLTITML